VKIVIDCGEVIVKKMQRKVIRFLKQYRMDPADVDFAESVEAFLSEMQRGLAGRKSTLEMIPTYLTTENEVPIGKRVIVADAGGTNFRVATVYFDADKKPVIENLHVFTMPGVERQLSRVEFFNAMAEYFCSVADMSENIGFCFSYPVEIQPNKDGRMIRFSKEIKVTGVEGQLVGEHLNRALAAMGLPAGKHIVLLNDTVATLLAGVGYQNRVFDSFIGFILGTGTNCAYIEHNAEIKKKKGLDPRGTQIINTESGGMGRGYRGTLDVRFDKTTVNPGVNVFEKMISGAYLGPLCLFVLRQACRDGLFSKHAAAILNTLSDFDTKDMNMFLLYPYGGNPLAEACRQGGVEDILTAWYIADRLTERAAKLSAVNLAAMAVKSGRGIDPTRPICIVAEGTTFYKMKSLKSRIEYYLKQFLENKKGIFTDMAQVENATLIGAAIAGLTN
jgi:hexokinase